MPENIIFKKPEQEIIDLIVLSGDLEQTVAFPAQQ